MGAPEPAQLTGPNHPPARLPGRTGSGFLSGAGCWQVFGLASFSALAAFLPPTASQPIGQCTSWASFSLTAAGQPRSLTGFPLEPESQLRHQRNYNILCLLDSVKQYVVTNDSIYQQSPVDSPNFVSAPNSPLPYGTSRRSRRRPVARCTRHTHLRTWPGTRPFRGPLQGVRASAGGHWCAEARPAQRRR
jgi:hypothetical protein